MSIWRNAVSTTLKSLGIDQLSREERLALVEEIWNSIAADQSKPLLNEAQRRELERRVAEDDAAPQDVVPWEQVKAQTLSRLQP
jgi:putative addiction module component (TIGR02574 family)